MRQLHLTVHGDQGFENKANLLGYLQGREISTFNIQRGAEYLMGRRGVKLHWAARPSQAREQRGHRYDANDPNAFRWMPKDEVNRPGGPGLLSHSSNPKFNGQLEREQREAARRRFNHPSDDAAAAHNYIWKQVIEKAVAEGRTHSERQRIALVAQQTSGGPRLQAEAAKREAALIRQYRERGR